MTENLTYKVSISDFKIIQSKNDGEFITIPSYHSKIADPITEFLEIIEIVFDDDFDKYEYTDNIYKNNIAQAVIAYFDYYKRDYEYFKERLDEYKRSGEIPDISLFDLISIDIDVLRDMAKNSATREEIAGKFITEVQTNHPEFSDGLDAKSALIFATGVTEYTQEVLGKAKEQISEADARTSEALAAKDTAETTEGVSNAIKYWDDKYEAHKTSKNRMFFAFASVLVAGIIVVFFGESLLPGAPGGENGDPGYKWAHYLRVVVVPTLAVAWLLRLISRQFITHMLLQEDARLRQTLVRTFLGLQRNPDAEIADKERAHMLEAIFRPLPVTPSGDVNQPSFADIAKLPK